jgi:hypothetical protein
VLDADNELFSEGARRYARTLAERVRDREFNNNPAIPLFHQCREQGFLLTRAGRYDQF